MADRVPIHDSALLLHKTPFSDSSLIVTWFTREHGKLKTMLKGARRPKSPFQGCADHFLKVDLGWQRARQSEIHYGTETGAAFAWRGIAGDYARMSTGIYFAELLDILTALEDPAPDLFRLLEQAWEYLDLHDPSWKLMVRYEKALAIALGFAESGATADQVRHALNEHASRRPASRGALEEMLR